MSEWVCWFAALGIWTLLVAAIVMFVAAGKGEP